MSETKIDNEAPASEEKVVESGEQIAAEPAEKMVPLSALEAERKKRQELAAQNKVYEEFLLKQQESKKAEQPAEDDEEFATRGHLKKEKQVTKQEILEQVFVDSNPDKMEEVNAYLEKIVERKPWLRETIAAAPNRYARAYEIVQDYKHLVVQQKQNAVDAKRIVENANKPGSPAQMGKSDAKSNSEFLLSIRGTQDFRKYRQEVQGRR